MIDRKVFFIINKYSGTGFQSKIEGRIIDSCARLKLEAILEYTQYRGHAIELARQAAAEGILRVFAMGGDGTVNEAAQGLIGTSTALGILPKGSGNGLARHLRIPLPLDRALNLLEQYNILEMDVLRINDKISVNVSGIGFDAHVAGQFGKNGKRGLAGYTRLVLQEFRSFKEFDCDAVLDGKTYHRNAFIIALANSSQFGNNARIAPLASVCDGVMDVCFIKKIPVAAMPAFTTRMFLGKTERSRFVEIVKASRFKIKFNDPQPYHIDGEPHDPIHEFVVEVLPASLKVIVPAATGKAI
ncbi:MAG TPA: diacylglycerol kinase family lipid kinase [Cyclobacteriaceae bacterium]|nr:diacylglycerol kinase family lipid kinase [Cyclobacteriaceae bacterium]